MSYRTSEALPKPEPKPAPAAPKPTGKKIRHDG